MSKCGKCNADVSFMSVMKTPNPLRVKCNKCGETVKLETKSALISSALIIVLSLAVIFYIKDQNLTSNIMLYVVLPVWFVAEGAYFGLIKAKLVKIKA